MMTFLGRIERISELDPLRQILHGQSPQSVRIGLQGEIGWRWLKAGGHLPIQHRGYGVQDLRVVPVKKLADAFDLVQDPR